MPLIKKPSRYIKPVGYRAPKEIIESHNGINKYETIFVKNKGPFEELKTNSKSKSREGVVSNLKETFDYDLHNHIYSKKDKNNRLSSVPSTTDIISAYERCLEKPNSASIISIISNGKEIGRTHFKITEKTIKLLSEYLEKNEHYKKEKKESLQDKGSQRVLKGMYINSFLSSKLYEKKIIVTRSFPWFRKKRVSKYVARSNSEYLNIIENEFGIKIRFVPMPGYTFNKEKILFEKDK